MRILLLSDIHSNLEALEACLHSVPSFEAVVNLGDIVGYGASPNEVTGKVREMGGSVVRGNHDRVVAALDDLETFNPVAALAALWNREHLTDNHLEWLRALPKGPMALPECPGVQFVHGAPEDEDRYVVTVEDSMETLAATEVGVTFFGHTHIQGIFCLHSGLVESLYPEYATIGNKETWEFPVENGAKYMINPGSIGQPRDRNPAASYAIYDSREQTVVFDRVAYDTAKARDKILRAGLPSLLGDRLLVGA